MDPDGEAGYAADLPFNGAIVAGWPGVLGWRWPMRERRRQPRRWGDLQSALSFPGAASRHSSAPPAVGYNAPFSIATTGGVARFTFVRLSLTTHTVNTDQRFLPAKFVRKGGGSFTVTSPLNTNIAPPGYYMLFALSATGVPSVSKYHEAQRHARTREQRRPLPLHQAGGGFGGQRQTLGLGGGAQRPGQGRQYYPADGLGGERGQRGDRKFAALSGGQRHRRQTEHLLAHGICRCESAAAALVGGGHGEEPSGGWFPLPAAAGRLSSGRIARYKFYVSANGVNWGRPVAHGTFANNKSAKTVTFGAAP